MEDIKTALLRVAREMDESNVTDCGKHGVVVTLMADELAEVVRKTLAELQKDATPVCYISSRALEQLAYGDDSVDTGISAMRVFLSDVALYTNPHPKAATVPEVVLKALKSCQRKQIIHECAPAENYKTYDSDLVAEAVALLEAAPSLPAQSEGEQK